MELNKIHQVDCLKGVDEIETRSVNLIVSSPPYPNAEMWNQSNETIEKVSERLNNLALSFLEKSYRILADGGIICWNIADIPCVKEGTYPTQAKTTLFMIEHNFRFLGSLIWQKNLVQMKPVTYLKVPVIPAINHEYILVFTKGKRVTRGETKQEDIQHIYKSIWDIQIERNRPDHICPYPLELPARCIRLFTIEGDTVLDPFMGSGTTAIACKQLNRNFIGFEIEDKNIKIANERLSQILKPKPNFGGYFK